MLLRLEGVNSFYGGIQALHDVSLEVKEGEVVSLIGSNGAGKTTTLMSIMGVLKQTQGLIEFAGETISKLSCPEIVKKGIVCVPEGRRIFPKLSVMENLEMGAYSFKAGDDTSARISENLDRVFQLFPVLKARQTQLGGTLSGGEQQMLALGRGLMAGPKMLLLDEPSLGLAPTLVEQVIESIVRINQDGTTVLLVEQNALAALEISHRGYVLENGRISLTDTAQSLLNNDDIRRTYLGA